MGTLIFAIIFLGITWYWRRQTRPHAIGFDYSYHDDLIPLDAEDLAEGGVNAAYEEVKPHLQKWVQDPIDVLEVFDQDRENYEILAGRDEFLIYSKSTDTAHSWGLASFALFSIINNQLVNSNTKFYAVMGGNDLHGIFLNEEALTIARSQPDKREWPYLPTQTPPNYGSFE